MPEKEKKQPSFEDALARLETIVEQMESGKTTLDDMLKLFEEGRGLVALCNTRLDETEKKIEKLAKTSSGEIKPVPFDAQ